MKRDDPEPSARTLIGSGRARLLSADAALAETAALPAAEAGARDEVLVTVPRTSVRPRPDSPRPEGGETIPLSRRFSLGETIGSGAMGEVIAARDGRLHRELAIKVLSARKARSSAAVSRFVREARVTAQLSHPNVVPVYGLEQTADCQPALAMKLVRGQTFAEYIDRCREAGARAGGDDTLGLATRIEHFLKVCDAIAYSHDRGVLHRDIKPANLMLGGFGEVYVMDWGMARLCHSPELEPDEPGADTPRVDEVSTVSTRVGAVLGTPLYMAPEQAKGAGAEVGPAADQYALGMVLYELAALRPGRAGETLAEVLAVARAGTAPDFEGIDARTVPPDLRAIIGRAVAARPADRYPSVARLADDLRRFVRGDEVTARPDNLPRRLWRRLRRHPVAVLGALLAALLITSAAVTGSLIHTVDVQRRSAANEETLAGLIARVSGHAADLDAQFFRVQVLLEGLGRAIRDRVDALATGLGPGPGSRRLYSPSDLASGHGPEGTRKVARFGQLVNLRHANYVIAPGVGFEAVRGRLTALSDLEDVLRESFLRSVSEEAATATPAQADELIAREAPLTWAYVGFADGTMLNFPANAVYASGYDPRKRPWFTSTRGTYGPRWGPLYPDAAGTGFLMPCNEAVYDRSGRFVGVAGLDMGLDRVIEGLRVPGMGTARASYLVDARARIVLESADLGTRTATDWTRDEVRRTRPLHAPRVAAQIRAGRASGAVREGERLYVFARLRALSWTLVVALEADHYLR